MKLIKMADLPSSLANAYSIRRFFDGFSIPEEGVLVVGFGYAFILFSTEHEARRAVAMDGRHVDGKPVRIELYSKIKFRKLLQATNPELALRTMKDQDNGGSSSKAQFSVQNDREQKTAQGQQQTATQQQRDSMDQSPRSVSVVAARDDGGNLWDGLQRQRTLPCHRGADSFSTPLVTVESHFHSSSLSVSQVSGQPVTVATGQKRESIDQSPGLAIFSSTGGDGGNPRGGPQRQRSTPYIRSRDPRLTRYGMIHDPSTSNHPMFPLLMWRNEQRTAPEQQAATQQHRESLEQSPGCAGVVVMGDDGENLWEGPQRQRPLSNHKGVDSISTSRAIVQSHSHSSSLLVSQVSLQQVTVQQFTVQKVITQQRNEPGHQCGQSPGLVSISAAGGDGGILRGGSQRQRSTPYQRSRDPRLTRYGRVHVPSTLDHPAFPLPMWRSEPSASS